MNDADTSVLRTSARMSLPMGMLLAAAACGDERPIEPAPRIETIVIETGDEQTAATGEPLPTPIVARAFADDGSDYSGTVTVAVLSGAGTISLGSATGSGNGASIEATPSGGRVEIIWTMGEPSVDQRLRFWALRGGGDTVSAFATATATPTGDGGLVGGALPTPGGTQRGPLSLATRRLGVLRRAVRPRRGRGAGDRLCSPHRSDARRGSGRVARPYQVGLTG